MELPDFLILSLYPFFKSFFETPQLWTFCNDREHGKLGTLNGTDSVIDGGAYHVLKQVENLVLKMDGEDPAVKKSRANNNSDARMRPNGQKHHIPRESAAQNIKNIFVKKQLFVTWSSYYERKMV